MAHAAEGVQRTRSKSWAMISSEVQRTLVKSPPELWAELSDPAALARHLGELGEIKITKVEPERTVEWEAEAAKGKVELKPSGWGTKVTLSVTHAPPEVSPAEESRPEQTAIEQRAAEPETSLHPPATAAEAEPSLHPPATGAEAEPETDLQSAMTAEEAEPKAQRASRRGFLARLFRRRARIEPDTVPDAITEPEPPENSETAKEEEPTAEPADPTTEAADLSAEPADLSAELAQAEQAIEAQTTEMLKTVLDRLGAAHHRPFSRA
jgi:hypothetical protein